MNNWTKEELDFLYANYVPLHINVLHAKVGRTKAAIHTMARKLGLRKRKIPLNIGDRYEKLVILKHLKGTLYLCACDCGNTTEVYSSELTRQRVKSCGCFFKDKVRKPEGFASFVKLYANSKANSSKRNHEFKLTREEHKEIVTQNCYYCGSEPKPFNGYLDAGGVKIISNGMTQEAVDRSWINVNGIDRLDSELGYTVTNCVPCCSLCNYAKRTSSVKVFLEHVSRIANYQNTKVGKL